MYFVPHAGQLAGEVVEVDSLPPGVHVPLVHDEADLHPHGLSSGIRISFESKCNIRLPADRTATDLRTDVQ